MKTRSLNCSNAQADNANHSSDPLADDLLQRLNGGRLRVDLKSTG